MKKQILIVILSLVLFSIPALATVEYGNGWRKVCDDNNNCYYSNYLTYLRYDGVYIPQDQLNIDNGNWSYDIKQNSTHYNLFLGDDTLSLPKEGSKYKFGLDKISFSITFTPASLSAKTKLDGTEPYLSIPTSSKNTKFIWDNAQPNIYKNGSKELIFNKSYYSYLNSTTKTGNKTDGKDPKVTEITKDTKIYYDQKLTDFISSADNVTFEFNSWNVGVGGNAWSVNTTMVNASINYGTGDIVAPLTFYDNFNDGNTNTGWNKTHYGSITQSATGGSLNITDVVYTSNDWVYSGLNSGNAQWLPSYSALPAYWQLTWNGTVENNGIDNVFQTGFMAVTAGNLDIESLFLSDASEFLTQTIVGSYDFDGMESEASAVSGRLYRLKMIYNETGYWTYYNNTLLQHSNPGIAPTNIVLVNSVYYSTNLYPFANYSLIDDVKLVSLTNNAAPTTGYIETFYDAGLNNRTNSITVNLSSIPTGAKYTISSKQNSSSSYVEIGTPNATSNQSVTPSVKYQNTSVRVQFYNVSTSKIPELAYINFTSGISQLPQTPNISYPVNASRLNNNVVNATWNSSTTIDGDITTYQYQLSTMHNFSLILLQSNTTNNYSGNIATTEGTTYYLRVLANDTYNVSAWSNLRVQRPRAVK